MIRITSLLLLAVLFTTTACAEEEQKTTVNDSDAGFKVITITEGLSHPWSLAFLPNGDYLVTEREGNLLRITPQGKKFKISNVPTVYNEGQGGLLDIVPEPNFKDGGWVYFSYAAIYPRNKDLGNTEVARAKLNIQQNRLFNLEVIFKANPKLEGSNHWGSRLLFAPDGTLFITLGEKFNYKEEAQNTGNHLGALIRINPDGSIPKDNPFLNDKNALPEIYSYGHRNPQGIALHPETKDIWMHEHGPKGGDEINIIKAGANYGWPAVTFGINYWGTKISNKTTAPSMEDPILQWTPSIAPSGMSFYTGDKFPQWKGDLFVGALAHRHLRHLDIDGEEIKDQIILLKKRESRIRDVREGFDGYLYVLTDSNNGQLLQLKPL